MRSPKTSNLDILIHSNYTPLTSQGGIETVVLQLLTMASSVGYSVECFCGDSTNGVVKSGPILVRCRRILWRFRGACLLSFGNSLLIKYARDSHLIIYQEPYPTLWPALLVLRHWYRIPIIVLVHADPTAPTLIKRLYGKLRSFTFSGCTCVATSPSVGEKVFSPQFVDSKVIPLCLPDLQHSDSPVPVPGLPGKYALYLGRIVGYKGIEYLLEAAQMLPHVNFVIAGSGPLSRLVSDFISEKELTNICFISRFVSESEKEFLITKSQFFVFPSVSENEAFGIVQVEAMRAGRAIVNTDLGTGVNFVAPHMDCALTVPKKSAEKLGKAIDRLWSDDELRASLGANALKRYTELFAVENFRKNWQDLIAKTIRSSLNIN
jgi:glycosyltransferase involved in cell wall biosynthesis